MAIAASAYCLWPETIQLVVENAAGENLYAKTVKPGDRFSIVFTHSYARSRVEEVFEVTGSGEFTLRETVYADFGAGLPHEETAGYTMSFSDGKIRLQGYDTRFNELRLRVGHIADHRLEFPAAPPQRLAMLARPGAELRLAVTARPWGFGG